VKDSKLIWLVSEIRNGDDLDDFDDLCQDVCNELIERKWIEQLEQMAEKPIYDGDVICKTYRDALITLGLASRVMYRGGFGYTSTNYLGGHILKMKGRF
jgi:hypothetical protein